MAEIILHEDGMERDEIESLARELASAYARRVAFYRTEYRLSAADAEAKAQELGTPEFRQRALTDPPDHVSYSALNDLGEQDPARALVAWQRVKAAAQDELLSGHRAAEAMEVGSLTGAWQRARFLAIRAAFLEQWQPANGGERLLVDMLAQAYASWLDWLEQLQVYSVAEASSQRHRLQQDGAYDLPRLSRTEAMEHAAAMADRFNRLFLRTLRQLRDLRRYAPVVTIQRAGQVNIAHQQVNATQME